MTTSEGAVENSKYKLLGFENDKRLAVIMVIATGKVLKIKLSEVLSSEMMDNFNKMEIKNLYKKFYSQGGTLTAYDINDRNENSWMIYIILNLLLFTFYIFTSIAATKPIYLESLGIIVTPGTFLYPLTFLIVDLLNENFWLAPGQASHSVCVCQQRDDHHPAVWLHVPARATGLEAGWALYRRDPASVVGAGGLFGLVPGVGEYKFLLAVQDQGADQLQVSIPADIPQYVLCGDYRQLPVLLYRLLRGDADQRHPQHDLCTDRDQSRLCVLQHPAGLRGTFIVQALSIIL